MEIDRLGIVSMIPLARNELGGEEKIGYDESFYFFRSTLRRAKAQNRKLFYGSRRGFVRFVSLSTSISPMTVVTH